jgi:hypothetical protein
MAHPFFSCFFLCCFSGLNCFGSVVLLNIYARSYASCEDAGGKVPDTLPACESGHILHQDESFPYVGKSNRSRETAAQAAGRLLI